MEGPRPGGERDVPVPRMGEGEGVLTFQIQSCNRRLPLGPLTRLDWHDSSEGPCTYARLDVSTTASKAADSCPWPAPGLAGQSLHRILELPRISPPLQAGGALRHGRACLQGPPICLSPTFSRSEAPPARTTVREFVLP